MNSTGKSPRATGESVNMISSMGFVLDQPYEAEPAPQVIDWDELQACHRVPFIPQRQRRAAV